MGMKIDFSYNYGAFAEALLDMLDLRGDVRVLPYGIDINPHGYMDGPMVIWLIAHATPEQVAEAEARVRDAEGNASSHEETTDERR